VTGSRPPDAIAAYRTIYRLSLRLVAMCVRYSMIRVISRSLILSAAKPGICIVGQPRTDFGSRMRACSPSRVMYSVGIQRLIQVGPKLAC